MPWLSWETAGLGKWVRGPQGIRLDTVCVAELAVRAGVGGGIPHLVAWPRCPFGKRRGSKPGSLSLAGWLNGLERPPYNKGTDWPPRQGTYLGCQFDPWSGARTGGN